MCTHKVYCQILSLAQCQQYSRHLAWFQWRLMCVYICTQKVVFQDNSFGHSCRVKTKQSLLWNWLHVFSIKMKIFLLFFKDVKWFHKLLLASVRQKKSEILCILYTHRYWLVIHSWLYSFSWYADKLVSTIKVQKDSCPTYLHSVYSFMWPRYCLFDQMLI